MRCKTQTLGLLVRQGSKTGLLEPSALSLKNPSFMPRLTSFMKKHRPDVTFTTVQVNMNTISKPVSKSSERAAREWSTVVDISVTYPSFKPGSASLSRSPLSKTPKQVFFNPINILTLLPHNNTIINLLFHLTSIF